MIDECQNFAELDPISTSTSTHPTHVPCRALNTQCVCGELVTIPFKAKYKKALTGSSSYYAVSEDCEDALEFAIGLKYWYVLPEEDC